MSIKFNVEEMRKKSLDARQNQDKDFEIAYEEAFQKVIEDAQTKIDTALNAGKFRAYLYIWHYVSDKDDRQFTFKNVRMLDIVTKGPLIARLQKHFGCDDPDQENRLFVGWHKFSNNTQRSRYGIYVSWAEKKDPSPSETETNDSKSEKQSSSSDSTSNDTSKAVAAKGIKSSDTKKNDKDTSTVSTKKGNVVTAKSKKITVS
jgi:hypothetical protein